LFQYSGSNNEMMRDYQVLSLVKSPAFPSRLYKFMKAEHAQLLCQRNRVRYGTIYDFRKQENHGHGVLDKEEGLIHYSERVSHATSDQLGEPLRGFFGSAKTELTNCNFDRIICTEPDQWVYCFSLSDSWEADIDPAYTVCVEIFDPKGFIMALTEKIARTGTIENFWNHAPVEYREREFSTVNDNGAISGVIPPRLGVIKPLRYADQKEYRVLYVPKNQGVGAIEPFCARIPGLTRYCRRHSVRPDRVEKISG
jgi:hypothetical protein